MKLRQLCLCALFAALTAIGAFLKIPFALSAITLQFFFTAMAGILLGAKLGGLSQLVYVLLGLCGLPIFTMGGGLGYVFQPSFGYLLGLIPAAWIIGKLQEKHLPYWAAMLCGLAALYAVGLPYLWAIMNLYRGTAMPFGAVVKGGMLLYLPGDALKIAAASVLCRKIRPVLARIFMLP